MAPTSHHVARQYAPIERQKLLVAVLAKRVAADKPVPLNGDIHDRRP
jgi:hypothetical protein